MVEKGPNWERGSMVSYSLATKELLLIMLRVAIVTMKMTHVMVVMAVTDGSSAVPTSLWLSSHPISYFMGRVSPVPQMKKGQQIIHGPELEEVQNKDLTLGCHCITSSSF